MRLKATSISDYSVSRGVLSNTKTPVWQFICMDDTPFFSLLQPEDEVVEVERKVSMFELSHQLEGELLGVEVDSGSVKGDNVKTVDETGVVGSELSDRLFGSEKSGFSFTPNKSVVGLGVSFDFAKKNVELLSSIGTQVFVYCDLRSKSLSDVKSFIEENVSSITRMFYVLHISLSFSEYLGLGEELKEIYRNIRFIGDNVVKIDGSGCFGLLSSDMARHYSLEFNYKSNVHSTTQVKLVQRTCSSVPIETLDYDSAIKGVQPNRVKSPKVKIKKEVDNKNKPKTKSVKTVKSKSGKAKLDRKALFG